MAEGTLNSAIEVSGATIGFVNAAWDLNKNPNDSTASKRSCVPTNPLSSDGFDGPE